MAINITQRHRKPLAKLECVVRENNARDSVGESCFFFIFLFYGPRLVSDGSELRVQWLFSFNC
jgi:hypothetical protein